MVGEIEPVVWRKRPGVIAANQLVLMAHCFKAVSIDEATKLIAAAPQFEGWTRPDTEAVLQVLAERWVLRFTPVPSEVPWYRWPKAVYEVAKEEASARGETLPEDLPLYNTPDQDVPPLVHGTNRGRAQAIRSRVVVDGRKNPGMGVQPPLDDSGQDVPGSRRPSRDGQPGERGRGVRAEPQRRR